MILFLDIDGVLATVDQHRAPFDPHCVKNVNVLLKKLNPRIVISSNWRNNNSLEHLDQYFTEQGIIGHRIVDKTICLYPNKRCYEILHWINRHEKEDFLILDDLDDVHHPLLDPYFVKTSFFSGFDEQALETALKILSI